MRIWIDATQPEANLCVFGFSLLERQLRNIRQSEKELRRLEKIEEKLGGVAHVEQRLREIVEEHIIATEIWIELPEGQSPPTNLETHLIEQLPIRWVNEGGGVRERLQRALHDAAGEPLLALSGDTIIDERIVGQLKWWTRGSIVFISGTESTTEDPALAVLQADGEPGAAMKLDEPLKDFGDPEDDLLKIAEGAVQSGAAQQLQAKDLYSYIKKLRRSLPPYLVRIRDQQGCDRVERFLFASNYKGSTDFLTKWVYPPIVWALLKPLAKRRVRPNTVTAVGMVACFLSIPFFAAGMWVPGLALAYMMSILDSVDGKLARVTFQSSPQGDVLDHGTDIIHPPFWYLAWAWGLSGGDPYSGIFVASSWMTVFYILDRLMETLFKSCTGFSIHGYTLLDERMRTVISRRNVNLAILTVALPLGLGAPAFFFMTAWQGLTFLFHLSRVVKFWNAPKQTHERPGGGAAEDTGMLTGELRLPNSASN